MPPTDFNMTILSMPYRRLETSGFPSHKIYIAYIVILSYAHLYLNCIYATHYPTVCHVTFTYRVNLSPLLYVLQQIMCCLSFHVFCFSYHPQRPSFGVREAVVVFTLFHTSHSALIYSKPSNVSFSTHRTFHASPLFAARFMTHHYSPYAPYVTDTRPLLSFTVMHNSNITTVRFHKLRF